MYNHVFRLHAELLKALAHPKRLEIVHLLRDQEMCVSEMQKMLGVSQANVSQHLQLMRAAGVVSARREGKQLWYRIAHRQFLTASDAVRELLLEQASSQVVRDAVASGNDGDIQFAVDPVCGMHLSAKTASYILHHEGVYYYFCAEGCMHTFSEEPATYVSKNSF